MSSKGVSTSEAVSLRLASIVFCVCLVDHDVVISILKWAHQQQVRRAGIDRSTLASVELL